jgi:transposase
MSRYVVSEEDRNQISMFSFEDMIEENNPVRVIEAFIDSLDMKAMGFKYAETKETGRKPHNPADMMKLYTYGYLNGIRSSRKLEKETIRNIEVIWLLDSVKPDSRTICDFRKDNISLLKNVFKQFSMLCNELGLYGKEIVAIDGSKFRASNARKKNYTKGKIKKQIEHFEKVAQKYLEILEECDSLKQMMRQ